jgi:hypothetical protein
MAGADAEKKKDELTELIEFLTDVRVHLRQPAAEIVKGLTGSPEGIESLLPKASSLLPALFRNMNDPYEQVSRVSDSRVMKTRVFC